jgi:hypothetical protein
MQRRKIVIACLSLLIVGLALPTTSINKAHAFTSGNNSYAISNILTNFASPSGFGSGTVAQGGTTVTVTVTVQASAFNNPAYQRNVTIGYKGDWMTTYQNATILTLTTSQIATTNLAIALPSVTAISPSHTWQIEVWDGPASGNVGPCQGNDSTDQYRGSGTTTACFQLAAGSISLLTGDQYSAAQARNSASTIIGAVGLGGLGNAAANAQLDQANAEQSLGDQNWRSGDFAGAKTHYQNALNDANAALATAYNLSGGQGNAVIISPILAAVGTVMFGLGGLLAGIGGFFYLKRRPKA